MYGNQMGKCIVYIFEWVVHSSHWMGSFRERKTSISTFDILLL